MMGSGLKISFAPAALPRGTSRTQRERIHRLYVGDVRFHRHNAVPRVAKLMLGKVFQQFHNITLLSKRKRKSHPNSSIRHVSGAI